MANLADQRMRALGSDLEALEALLGKVADELLTRSRAPGPQAIELLNRGAALHQAAFVLKSVISDEVVDLRTSEGQAATNRS